VALNAQDTSKLRRIIALAEKLIEKAPKAKRGRPPLQNGNGAANGKRVRRTGKELVQFRKMLKAERKKGISVAELARRHGVSAAYIYSLP
jgi:DNA invertase Pin-like site-specific DNA recombinase